jgi:uncharacterized protein
MILDRLMISVQSLGQLISQETIDDVIAMITTQFSPEKILLFGSYAHGIPTPDSDLDLMVVMETDRPRNKRSTPIRLLFKPMPCSMDILVVTPEEVKYWNGTVNHIITEAFQTGKVLYDGTR